MRENTTVNLKRIASFSVDHDVLLPGVYVSRQDGDVISYDVRMKRPNGGDYLAQAALHTLEHLLATYLRNTAQSDNIVYVGPMGCRTGFYILLRDKFGRAEVIELLRGAFAFAADFCGEIPGAKRQECGNYLEHDLPGAQKEAAAMLNILQAWTPDKMTYAK